MILSFPSEKAKAQWLEAQTLTDWQEPVVKRLAAQLYWESIRLCGQRSSADFDLTLARTIHNWVRDNIRYVKDVRSDGTRGEQFASPTIVIGRGYDDCDGKSRAVVALVKACRNYFASPLDARLLCSFSGGTFVHVQSEILVNGEWLLSDAIVAGFELGDTVDQHRDAAGIVRTT